MIGDIDTPGDEDQVEEIPAEEVLAEEIPDDDVVLIADDDTDVGGSTEEINVDALVAKIDSTDAEEAARMREVKAKLEALDEQRDDEFGSTYNFDLDKDL